MATISISNFSGIQPRIDPTSLQDGMATTAMNCRLRSTKIDPVHVHKTLSDTPIIVAGGLNDVNMAKTIHVWDICSGTRKIIAWGGDVHVSPSNINDEKFHRIFVSGDTGEGDEDAPNQPCVYVPYNSDGVYGVHKLFINPPPAAIVTNKNTNVVKDKERYTFFVQTWVDEFGYESGASDVGDEIVYNDGDTVTWSGVASTEIPYGIVARRLYKTIAGSSESSDSVKFVCEQSEDLGFSAKDVTVKDEDTGEIIKNITGIPLDLRWMTAVPGNFYAGFAASNKRVICFSDVNMPTNWPELYRYSISDDAVGLGVAGNTVFVLTSGFPWSITGSSPESMVASKIASMQPCISEKSICPFSGSVFYASPDGVCQLNESSSSANVITQSIWSREEWQKLNPSSCIIAGHDAALFLFFSDKDSNVSSCYCMDFENGGCVVTQQSISSNGSDGDAIIRAVHVDCVSDSMLFVKEEV